MKDIITNVTGALLAIVTILLGFNLMNNEQSTTLIQAVPILITSIGSIVTIFFAKDKK